MISCSSTSTGTSRGRPLERVFNRSGKTGILIRADNHNVFTPECKIWTGPRKFEQAIDQLLGYLAWRDTKAGPADLRQDAGA